MKFTKFGKALLMTALSGGVILGLTSCVQSYTVGFLYATGTETANPDGSGYIAGFKIDHNTGKLNPINGLNPPISSGGANPVRALLLDASRYVYVLNRGVNKEGNGDCTTEDPCLNSNITVFSVGANGTLTPQPQVFQSQGLNPFRIITDSTQSYVFVLDHDSKINGAPSSAANPNPYCASALGAGITTCGDVTVFSIDKNTGRLQLITNNAATAALGTTLTYFPVPSDPVDFVLFGNSNLLTLTATPATAPNPHSYPYTGGATVFSYTNGSGQLVANGAAYPYDTLNIAAGTAIVQTAANVYVLDNEPGNSNSLSKILPYTVGTNGALVAVAVTDGSILDDPNQSNPIYLISEAKSGKYIYVANEGSNVPTLAQSGIAGFTLNSPYDPTEISGPPIGFGTGAGPQCIVEDPSNQFVYTANANDSSVNGQSINAVSGNLTPLSQSSKAPDKYALPGPATWCLVDGRTD